MNRRDRHFGIGSVVKHYKGKIYRIEEFGTDVHTGEIVVVYRQMYPPYQLLIRNEKDFCDEIAPDQEGVRKYRFRKVSKKELLEQKEV